MEAGEVAVGRLVVPGGDATPGLHLVDQPLDGVPLLSTSEGHASRCVDDLAGYPACVVGGEEGHDVGHVFRPPDPAEGGERRRLRLGMRIAQQGGRAGIGEDDSGATELTVMPRGPSSLARARLKLSRAPLVAP